MLQSIINAIIPIAITAIVGVIAKVITILGDAGVDYIKEKAQAVAAKRGIDDYNSDLQMARDVWGIVDEYFRITPNVEKTLESTYAKFKEELLKKIPYLTDQEVGFLRQVVAGEVNKGRDAIIAPAVAK